MMTDPISDMLNRMRNAILRKYDYVDVPASKVKQNIVRIFKEEGFIRSVETVAEGGHPVLRIKLKYVNEQPLINGMRRISRPGRRVYVGIEQIPPLRAGLGVHILSTCKGILADRDAKKKKVGGEIICSVW